MIFRHSCTSTFDYLSTPLFYSDGETIKCSIMFYISSSPLSLSFSTPVCVCAVVYYALWSKTTLGRFSQEKIK